MSINRNQLYRVRQVKIDLDHSVAPFNFLPKFPLELTEVGSVKVSSTASIAMMTGAVHTVIQPWYFQPYVIEVSGKSYIGAYSNELLNVSVDSDIESLDILRTFINGQFDSTGFPLGVGVVLSYTDPDNPTNFGVSQEFVGVISDISVEESDTSPFMKSYSLKFVGEIKSQRDTNSGVQKAAVDQQPTREISQGVGDPVTNIKKSTQNNNATVSAQTSALPPVPLAPNQIDFSRTITGNQTK